MSQSGSELYIVMQCAIYGNFSAPKAQEIVVSRGTIIELLQPDDNGRMQTICSTEVFGMIRSLTPFRLNGAGKDCIIVGSDSGRVVILEFSKVSVRPPFDDNRWYIPKQK